MTDPNSGTKSVPPSAPLPPLPLDARSSNSCQSPDSPFQLSSKSPRKSTGGTQGTTVMGADAATSAGSVHFSISRPQPLGEPRRPERQALDQGGGHEFGEKDLPAAQSRLQVRRSETVPPPPPPKSGLLKRFATRLTATRSSPALRPTTPPSSAATSHVSLETPLTPQEDHDGTSRQESKFNPASNSARTPRPPPLPPKQQQSLGQSLNARLSIATRAEKRAEKRDAKAREEKRATNARRAAALAEVGLLPASRRYSGVPVPANDLEHAFDVDPFAKDGINRESEGSNEGVEVEERTEGDVSAAAAVIREWRERNARANGIHVETVSGDAADPDESKKLLSSKEAEDEVPSTPTTPRRTSKSKKSIAISVEQDTKNAQDKSDSPKAETGPKAALGAWRFPITSSSAVEKPSGSLNLQKEDKSGDVFLSLPMSPRSMSSTSIVIRGPKNSLSSREAPPPPPPKPEAETLLEKGRTVPVVQKTSLIQRSPIAPTATQASAARGRTQKPRGIRSAPSQGLNLSLPALSPTTSTSTSKSGGSALPRTPSTSSHGHSPVCVLDAPLEHEEDNLLFDEPMAIESVLYSKSEGNKRGVKEFGELASRAALDPECGEDGALPPLPLSASRGPSVGNGATPVIEGRTQEDEKRKRNTLFGRRRTTQNSPAPMITIPENTTGVGSFAKNNVAVKDGASALKPRHVSSLTNLKRTVTSVTAGLGVNMLSSLKTPPAPPSTLMDNRTVLSMQGSSPNCDRIPVRGATMPAPCPYASQRSCTSEAESPSAATNASTQPSQRSGTGVGLRVRPLNPTMHSRGSILLEAHAIEDEESRRLSELAFLV